jgi:Transposase, Mutator family
VESTQSEHSGEWNHLPLSRRYLLINFVVQPAPARAPIETHAYCTTWALGTHSDGHQEVLGTWQHESLDTPDWASVLTEFIDRGVKDIRYVLNADAAAIHSVFPRSAVLDATALDCDSNHADDGQRDVAQLVRCAAPSRKTSPGALPRRVRQLACRSLDVASAWGRSLTQASTRHSPFESGAAAAAFIGGWLSAAERKRTAKRTAVRRVPTAPVVCPAR